MTTLFPLQSELDELLVSPLPPSYTSVMVFFYLTLYLLLPGYGLFKIRNHFLFDEMQGSSQESSSRKRNSLGKVP